MQKNGVGRGNGSANSSLYGIKKLRELILELAVRGKLVPQDPNDELASLLLEKIAKEKARLIKEGKIKKQEPLPEISDEEKPFELPQGWKWVRLGGIAQHNSGKTLDGGRNSGSLREYITTSNLYWGYFVLNELRQMPFEDEELEKCTAKQFDLLICEGGEAGRAAVWNYDFEICFQNHIHRVSLYGGIDPYYVFRLLQTMSFSGEIDLYRKGVGISNMSGKALSSILVPLPPLSEQHRIVAKVDELMALCDQLEQQQNDNYTVHQTLVETLLEALMTSTSPHEFAETWQRIVRHFDMLFTTEQSIDQLKQTILQLAVMGKLVPQDQKDEPASSLLEKINDSLCHENNIKNLSKLKRDKATIDPREFHHDIPENWTWCELQDIAIFTNGKAHEQYITKEPQYILVNSRFVSTSGEIRKYATERLTPLKKGDITIVMSDVPDGRALVRCYLVDNDHKYTLNQRIGCITSSKEMNKKYLILLLNRNKYYLRYDDGKKQTNLKKIQIMSCPIPLPPIAEQHRIVAKIDELMALCDQLKARLREAQTTKIQLADAIVEQAVL